MKHPVDFSLHPALLGLTFITFLGNASSVLQLLHTVISRTDQSFLGEILFGITIPLSLQQNYIRLLFLLSFCFCTLMQAHISSVIHSSLWVFLVITTFQVFWIILPKINRLLFLQRGIILLFLSSFCRMTSKFRITFKYMSRLHFFSQCKEM